jgi:hypothetical protein
MAFQLTVHGFRNGGEIARIHTGEGADLAPGLEWTGEPEATRSFVLIVDDPDAPVGTWNHWLLWDIPAGTHLIRQGFKPGTLGLSGTNDFGKAGYGGPMPPRGHGSHRYFFRLYASGKATLGLKAGAKRKDLDKALEGSILAVAEYLGRYERA